MTSADPRAATARVRWLPLILVAAGVAVYANSLPNPFVFDDIPAIVDNRHIRQLWPLTQSLTSPPQATVAGRPLVSLTLALNHAVSGLDVRGYHTMNLAFHLSCGLLLFGVLRRTLRSPRVQPFYAERADGIALATALLWLVHPLTSEVVNYLVQRTESVMAACYLLTLYCAIRADGPTARTGAWSVGAILACALGMASKESMVTAPVAVLLHDMAFARGSPRQWLARRRWWYAGLAGCWLLLAGILWTGPRSETVGFGVGVGVFDYAANQCVVIVDYLRSAVWPHPLVFDYGDARPLPRGVVTPYALALLALIVAAAVAFVKRPTVGYAAVWFFMTLAPTSSLVPIASEVGAERRMYLPLAGLSALLVVAIVRLLSARGSGSFARGAGLALLLIVGSSLSVLTVRRNLDYRTHERIWRTAVAARPENPRAHVNLGQALQVSGRTEEAIASHRRALALDPGYAHAHFNLGVAFAEQGRNDEALVLYRRALELNPNLPEVHHNLASELGNRGQLEQAIVHFTEAVRLSPESATGQQNLGRALRLDGRAEQALLHLRQAVRLDPDSVEALGDVAWILATHPDARLRDAEQAIAAAGRAVELTDRGHALSLDTLAAALAEAGRFEEAVTTAREARRRASDAALQEEIDRRLRSYLSGRPYREAPGQGARP